VSRSTRILIIAGVAAVAAVLAALLLHHDQRHPATDDAYVDADVVGIVAQVAGPITNLAVADNHAVGAGDLLFEIDPRPFRIQVEQTRAELDRTGQDVTALTDEVTSAEAGVRYA
jgi:multidrug resistance efflux pump